MRLRPAARVFRGGADGGPEVALRARLLDPARLARYDGLALHVRRGMGDRPGERRVPGRPQPSGIELEAHSAYAPGDDLRHLDWNVLARLDALLVRRFTAERDVVAHILLDASASLAVPAGDDKLGTACELAMALACVALNAGDAVRVAVLGGDAAPNGVGRAPDDAPAAPVFRQRVSIPRVATLLAGVCPQGSDGLGAALERYTARRRAPGLALVISDFLMEPHEVERAIQALRARGYDIHLLHVLGAGELDPTRVFSRGMLVDVESGATRPIALTAATLARYQAVLAAHLDALRALAARCETSYARLVAGDDVAGLLTGALARAGLVRRR
ncbi:MAG: DUF58 domain-containing protein [Deltaproteobacteria bacterium]|nr:DUF58 domain-containing protein [Deltaproteobacteria bacterium]